MERVPGNPVDLRVRRPVGVALSVRVPRDLAIAIDEYARARGMSMSDTVRGAVEQFMKGGVAAGGSVQATTTSDRLILNVNATSLRQVTTASEPHIRREPVGASSGA